MQWEVISTAADGQLPPLQGELPHESIFLLRQPLRFVYHFRQCDNRCQNATLSTQASDHTGIGGRPVQSHGTSPETMCLIEWDCTSLA
jgi:hypothetical protein